MIYIYESDNSYKYCKQLQRFTAKATFVQGSLLVEFIQHNYVSVLNIFYFTHQIKTTDLGGFLQSAHWSD